MRACRGCSKDVKQGEGGVCQGWSFDSGARKVGKGRGVESRESVERPWTLYNLAGGPARPSGAFPWSGIRSHIEAGISTKARLWQRSSRVSAGLVNLIRRRYPGVYPGPANQPAPNLGSLFRHPAVSYRCSQRNLHLATPGEVGRTSRGRWQDSCIGSETVGFMRNRSLRWP